ncbi:MAG: hypothetical protein GX801_11655, partial [Fibrobacter sp.]|nr:hypothetical protein [Fibrobacter sp.]
GQNLGGDDLIIAGAGHNTVLGGVGNDTIITGIDGAKLEDFADIVEPDIDQGIEDLSFTLRNDASFDREAYTNQRDLVLGDTGIITVGGTADLISASEKAAIGLSDSDLQDTGIVSFNFQGAASNGLSSSTQAGFEAYRSAHWNNIQGSLAGTYGNDAGEYVLTDDGSTIYGVALTYGGSENHRFSSTDNNINLQAYNHWVNYGNSGDNALMGSGLLTTAPNHQNNNQLLVEVDGLKQHFSEYDVVVYLDVPDQHSNYGESIRKVTLHYTDVSGAPKTISYYVNDQAGAPFNGFVVSDTQELSYHNNGSLNYHAVKHANCVIFSGIVGDNFRVEITDGYTADGLNGKDLPGIAGLQVKGTFIARDILASSMTENGGDDVISTGGGDDVVIGGLGDDVIATFGDIRHGIHDNDLVFGDNALVTLADRNGDGISEVISATSTGYNADQVQGVVSSDDIIFTGDGNDVVVGGEGSDRIYALSQAELDPAIVNDLSDLNHLPQALRDLSTLQNRNTEGLTSLSINFTTRQASDDQKVANGESAGAIADANWNNVYLYNNRFYVHGKPENNHSEDLPLTYSQSGLGQSADVKLEIYSYNAREGNNSGSNNHGNGSLTFQNHGQVDGDTANGKLFSSYYAAQQQEVLELRIKGINKVVGNGQSYDVYVYLDSANMDSDTYNYLYQILGSAGGKSESRYLNDWTGNNFNGEFREVTATSPVNPNDLTTPRVEMIGNYVVFRNYSGTDFTVKIQNYYSGSGQWPKNLPAISAVQVVASTMVADTSVYATGGDHDKDVVIGDNGKVNFALDIPYAADENIMDYGNKITEAISIPGSLNGDAEFLTNDVIFTGKDRDVVIGGDGSDAIHTGHGNDVAIGDNAHIRFHNLTPVGVFSPNAEIVLDQHTINNYNNGTYLDQSSANNFKNAYQNGKVSGVSTVGSSQGGNDIIHSGTGKNLVIGGEGEDILLSSATTDAVISTGSAVVKNRDNMKNPSGFDQALADLMSRLSANDAGIFSSFKEYDFSRLQSISSVLENGLGTETGSGSEPGNQVTEVNLSHGPKVVSLAAGETIKIVSSTYPGQDNPWWNPDIILVLNSVGGASIPAATLSYQLNGTTHTRTSSSSYYTTLDLPEAPNAAGLYEVYLTVAETCSISVMLGNA